jgi:hypothetical protein
MGGETHYGGVVTESRRLTNFFSRRRKIKVSRFTGSSVLGRLIFTGLLPASFLAASTLNSNVTSYILLL